MSHVFCIRFCIFKLLRSKQTATTTKDILRQTILFSINLFASRTVYAAADAFGLSPSPLRSRRAATSQHPRSVINTPSPRAIRIIRCSRPAPLRPPRRSHPREPAKVRRVVRVTASTAYTAPRLREPHCARSIIPIFIYLFFPPHRFPTKSIPPTDDGQVHRTVLHTPGTDHNNTRTQGNIVIIPNTVR